MKVLWLTNSDDMGDTVPEHLRSFRLAAARFEQETGELMEPFPRVVWPSEALPDLIDQWLGRYQPDIVMFKVNAYWYLYRSVPLQLRQRFGWLGRAAALAGEQAGTTAWIARTRAFHVARLGLLRTFGGASFFSPEYVSDLTEECARRILQHEHTGLVLHPSLDHWHSNPASQLSVHSRLSAFAAAHHVAYLGFEPGAPPPPDFYSAERRARARARAEEPRPPGSARPQRTSEARPRMRTRVQPSLQSAYRRLAASRRLTTTNGAELGVSAPSSSSIVRPIAE